MDHLFITDSDFANTDSSFQYVLWFQPSLWAMILWEKTLKIFLDGRYFQKTHSVDKERIQNILKSPDIDIEFHIFTQLSESIQESISGIEKLSIQDNIAIKYVQQIQKDFPELDIVYASNYFQEHRIQKNPQEKSYIKKAISIIDAVFWDIENQALTGELIWKTELQVRSEIIQKIFEYGWTWESFDTIVAFWKNSAIPHHTSGETRIWSGPLLIDMWARYEGYCSDFTRTFWVGEQTDEYALFNTVHMIVEQAYTSAYDGYTSGIPAGELDLLARKTIQDAWYGDYFIHSLGHGVGIDIHEFPKIKTWESSPLSKNMVFTIEPWIYLPNQFWVRLENIVFAETDWLKSYSTVPLS